MKNILKNLQGQDKLKHSKWGNIIFLLTFVTSLILLNVWQALLCAFFVLLFAAVSKELYDKYIKKTFIDWCDIVAAFIPYPLIKYIQKL
nr:MAG TPA: putative periplasmic lipoprotein [Caudoviricetes sp.]